MRPEHDVNCSPPIGTLAQVVTKPQSQYSLANSSSVTSRRNAGMSGEGGAQLLRGFPVLVPSLVPHTDTHVNTPCTVFRHRNESNYLHTSWPESSSSNPRHPYHRPTVAQTGPIAHTRARAPRSRRQASVIRVCTHRSHPMHYAPAPDALCSLHTRVSHSHMYGTCRLHDAYGGGPTMAAYTRAAAFAVEKVALADDKPMESATFPPCHAR